MRIRTRHFYAHIAMSAAIGITAASAWFLTRDQSATTIPNDWGTPVSQRPVDAPPGMTPMKINQGCKIATFGLHPWLPPGRARSDAWSRDTARALAIMGMPADAITLAVAKMQAGKFDEPVGMGDTHGVGTYSGTLFYPSMMTTYRMAGEPVVCLDSTTAFRNDQRSEFGTLYRVTDSKGKVWHVGEFVACGNVTLFTPGAPGWTPGNGMPGQRAQFSGLLPEPGSFLLLALGLVAIYAVWRVKKPGDKE